MPLMDTPFTRVAIDIVGPIFPASDKGNRFILTMVDYATRYPEAVALPTIETERVAEALVDMFSRVGVPQEVLSDRGSQFTGGMMKEVNRLLSIHSLTTTPYHPQCNGLVERFNGTLKSMLRKMSAERPKDWDKYLGAVLFAYREVPQESIGFSPFELLYGRTVRGPMTILRELWSKPSEDSEVQTTYQYVIDLKQRLEDTCQLAQNNLRDAAKYYKRYFDSKAKDRRFAVGQKVLVLLPTNNNKLLMKWKGPFTVEKVRNEMDCIVNMKGKAKIFHANMLKVYHERPVEDKAPVIAAAEGEMVSSETQAWAAVFVDVIEEAENRVPGKEEEVKEEEGQDLIGPLLYPMVEKESYQDVVVSTDLSGGQKRKVEELLSEFRDVLTDRPGRTELIEMEIKVRTPEPVRSSRGYPYHLREQIVAEVEQMEQLGVIERSESPYASPLILVKKKDGGIRTCVDLRAVNKITVFDSEPMPDLENIFARMGQAGKKYFSKFDLSKGYWQIPLKADSKEKTAFTTPKGLYQFTVMCFGLVTAPAVFSRMMRKLLDNLQDVDNFIDDIMIFSDTWEEHLDTLRELLNRLRTHKLTARPTKCIVGAGDVECLGHRVGKNGVSMLPDKVQAIVNAPAPITKRQVRAFLGLAGFYRKFIPNFAAIVVPLTDLTKKVRQTR